MSTMVIKELCETCGSVEVNGVCLNVDCEAAQAAATEDAARTTAKVAVADAAATGTKVTTRRPEPRSFNITGSVD